MADKCEINPERSDGDLIAYLTCQKKDFQHMIRELVAGLRSREHYGELATYIELAASRIENKKYFIIGGDINLDEKK